MFEVEDVESGVETKLDDDEDTIWNETLDSLEPQ